VVQLVKNPPAMWETWVQSLSWDDPPEKGKATQSSILAWRIPWTIYSPWGHKDSDTTEGLSLSLFTHTHTHTHTRICISSKVAARNVFHSKVVFKEVLFVNN